MLETLLARFGIDLGSIKAQGNELQAAFPPEWILRTLGAAAKKFMLENLAADVDPEKLGDDLKISPEDAGRVTAAVFDHLRRKY